MLESGGWGGAQFGHSGSSISCWGFSDGGTQPCLLDCSGEEVEDAISMKCGDVKDVDGGRNC